MLNKQFSYNQISDLSPLTFLPNLEVLDLESNHIESGKLIHLCDFSPRALIDGHSQFGLTFYCHKNLAA